MKTRKNEKTVSSISGERPLHRGVAMNESIDGKDAASRGITNLVVLNVFFLLLFCTVDNAMCQPNFHERTYGFGRAVYITNTRDGNYIIAANTGSYPGNQAYFLLINGNGDTVRTMSCPNFNVNCIRQTPEGGFVFVGDTGIYPFKTALVYKSDSVGNILWYSSYPSDEWGTWGSCISPDNENGYFISLVDDGAGSDNTYYVIKADSSGLNLDTAIVQYPESSFLQDPNSMQVTRDSGLVVVTSVPVFGLTRIVKFNSILTTQWNKVFIDTTNTTELNGNSICISDTSGYVVTGYTTPLGGGPGACGYLLKIDLNGDSVWSKEYCYPTSTTRFISSAKDTLGNIYIAGEYAHNSEHALILIKTNSVGDTIWTKLFSGYGYAYPGCLTLDQDQNPMIVGYTKDTISNQDYIYLVKTDTSGASTSLDGDFLGSTIPLHVYPNPVHSFLFLHSEDIKAKSYSFTVRNVFGQILLSGKEKDFRDALEEKIDFSFLPNGLYFLETSIEGHRTVNKVIKY